MHLPKGARTGRPQQRPNTPTVHIWAGAPPAHTAGARTPQGGSEPPPRRRRTAGPIGVQPLDATTLHPPAPLSPAKPLSGPRRLSALGHARRSMPLGTEPHQRCSQRTSPAPPPPPPCATQPDTTWVSHHILCMAMRRLTLRSLFTMNERPRQVLTLLALAALAGRRTRS